MMSIAVRCEQRGNTAKALNRLFTSVVPGMEDEIK
jgi:hypothetical protein